MFHSVSSDIYLSDEDVPKRDTTKMMTMTPMRALRSWGLSIWAALYIWLSCTLCMGLGAIASDLVSILEMVIQICIMLRTTVLGTTVGETRTAAVVLVPFLAPMRNYAQKAPTGVHFDPRFSEKFIS